MDTSVRKQFLVAECQSMKLLLTERLGTNHPWASIDFASVSDEELELAKRLLHELLYTPPART